MNSLSWMIYAADVAGGISGAIGFVGFAGAPERWNTRTPPDLTEIMGRQAREIAGLVGKNNELDAIRQQHIRQIAGLREALEPFAKVGYDIISSRDDAETIDDTMAAERLTWGDLRNAARALLAQSEGEG